MILAHQGWGSSERVTHAIDRICSVELRFDLPHLVTESEAEEHAKRMTASLKASKAAGIHEDVDPYYDEEDYDEQDEDWQ